MKSKMILTLVIGVLTAFAVICYGLYLVLPQHAHTQTFKNYTKTYHATATLDSVTLHGGTFDVDVTVFMCQDPTPALEFVQQNIDSSYTPKDFDASGVTFYKPGYPIVVWLPKVPETPWDISIANHELLHVTIGILNTSGISLSDATEEVYSYELGYLSEQFYTHVKNKFGSFNNLK